MRLPYHNRYPYSAIVDRRQYEWPGGKRLAFYVAVNIEHFAFAAGLGPVLTADLPQPDPRAFAWRDYGNRVGVWYLLEMLDQLGLPAAHLVNTAVFHYCPQLIKPIVARGDEFIGHGRTNAERQGQLFEEDEARLISTVYNDIAQFTGTPPRGWMGPWMSQSLVTQDLLKEAKFQFIMDWPADDQPLWMNTRAGKLMSVPYPLEINDAPAMLIRRHSHDQFEQMIIDQFEELLNRSNSHPMVCGVSLHTYVTGQPYRMRSVRRALQHIVNHPDRDRVWFTRPGAIFDHCSSLPPGTVVGV